MKYLLNALRLRVSVDIPSPPVPSRPTLGPNIPRVLFPRSQQLWGDSPPSIMGARCRHLRLARGSADSVCLRIHHSLVYAPLRPHTRPRTLTTPLHATTLHFTPTCSPPTPLHPIVISILAINSLSQARYWASSRQLLRTERPSTSPHALTKYTKEPWLYPSPPLTKERASVGCAQAPHRLSSCWCPFSIHSSNGLGCIVQVQMYFDVMFVTHKSMMAIPALIVTTGGTLPYPMLRVQRKTRCTCCACCAKHVMMTNQQFPQIRYVTCAV